MNQVPQGWAMATLGDVTVPFSSTDPRKRPNTKFTYVDIGSIDAASQTITGPRSFLGRDAPSRARRIIRTDDVLFSTVRTYLKNIAMVPPEFDGDLTSTGIAVLRANKAVEPRYLFNWVRSEEFIAEISASQAGTLYPAVADKSVKMAPIPVAPRAEQIRIVEKVDGLAARTSRARKHLDQIPILIARYKSVILAQAFAGTLTREWREQRGYTNDGNDGFPTTWSVKPLGEISEIQGGIQVGKRRPDSSVLVDVPYLRVANVQRGWLNLEEIKVLRVTAEERDRLLLRDGDILMNEGGDRDKLGRGWVWRAEIPVCIHQNHVFRIRLKDPKFPSEFVSHYANENGQQYFMDQGTQTTNLASISKRKVAALPVPIPSTEEASEIVRRIDSAFAWLDRIATHQVAAALLLPKLDAAILATAYRGKLVSQDSDDEPASLLLERTRAQRAGELTKTRERKSRIEAIEEGRMTLARNLEQVLIEAGDWVPSQTAFERCGIGDGASTEEIEPLYAELRDLDKAGKLQVEAVTDSDGRKLHDRLRLRMA